MESARHQPNPGPGDGNTAVAAVPGADPDGEQPASGGPQQVCWERFIQKKTIKVLLVESDDSTRQVVTALLRHCMYEVIPAENAQQAWTYLEDMQNNIDLVLTEVVMPGVSGISLLSKIMNHNTCKNVPVIMMSSNDAMSTVFKCLSKGAVDFLVKPIRKNELKNLWQHVWRRCHSSSGSGSESGIQTQKCAESKSGDESNNNSGRNDDNDDGVSMGLNARDGSDNGSGTQVQSSWTKRAVGIDSPQAMSPDQLADPPADSTCAQVIHPKSETCSNRWSPYTNNKNCNKQKETNDDFKGKDLEIGCPRNLNTAYQSAVNERSIKPTDRRCEYPSQNNSKEAAMENVEEPTVRAADLIGSMAKNMDAQQAARATNAPNCSSKVPEGKEKNCDNVNMPSLELSLKRPRSTTGDGANAAVQEEQRNVLRRSDFSAFMRYHTPVVSNQGGTGFVGSCSPNDNNSEVNMKSNSDAAPIKQGSNGSSNNNDMGSTTNLKTVVTKPSTMNKERVMSPSAVKANGHTSAFHPVQQHWTSPAANNVNTSGKGIKTDDNATMKALIQGEVKSNLVHHPRPMLHYVHFDVPRENNNAGGSGAPQCGSSNVFDPPVEGHAANYGDVNSGSNNNGSNGQNNGSTTAVNAERPDMEIANINGAINRSGPGDGSGSGSGNDLYMKRFALRQHRMAAVIKFRQRRKERNFGKKVRYQNRKRLAEQRPRFRGQFVRQAVPVPVPVPVQDQGGSQAAADK